MLAGNLIEATSDMGAFVLFSGLLKRVAVKLSKICNDLRLLSSGPRTGFGEIRLPAVQAGSSIMPGKVNPVIPEVVNQVAFLVIGNDLTVTLASEGGQLQLNAFEPTIAFCILQSMRGLTAALDTLTVRCIRGITADRGALPQPRPQQYRHRHGAQSDPRLRGVLARRQDGAGDRARRRRHRARGKSAHARRRSQRSKPENMTQPSRARAEV